jgi:hypothetical protein
MITVQLTEAEHTLLVDLLERVCAHAREELVHTNDHAYRDMLKEQEQRIRALFDEISTSQSPPRALNHQEEWP